MQLEPVPLCHVTAQLEMIDIGPGPAGHRMLWEVAWVDIEGERLRAKSNGRMSIDWMVFEGGVGTLDVRTAFETDDVVLGLVQYGGRVDLRGHPDSVGPVYATPRFEVADSRYDWLKFHSGSRKGEVDQDLVIRYEWFELK